uniref:Uncharacterized protein n=1 Tax=Mus spicilegus TaxID=10103 RepID=A0A8C6INB1_MUSSI
MTDCLYSKCIHCITDCVMTKTEKLGQKYHEALRISRDPQFDRYPCTHKGTYAVDLLTQSSSAQVYCYIVTTVGWDLKQRILKFLLIPIMWISNQRAISNTCQMTMEHLSSNPYWTKFTSLSLTGFLCYQFIKHPF